MSRRPRPEQAPPFGTSPGPSGWCLNAEHGDACLYPACTCTCHERSDDE